MMNKNVKDVVMLIAIAFSITAMMIGCNDAESEEAQQRKSRREAFVADSLAFKVAVLPTEDCQAIIVAKEMGFFDSLGVDVRLRRYKALSECRYALSHGMVQGAAIDSVLASVIEKDDSVPLFLGESTSLAWKMVASKKSRVLRVAQLVDKVVAADSHGASHTIADSKLDSLRKKGHLAFVIQAEDVEVRCAMLAAGNVDAAMLPEPYAAKAVKNGSRVLYDGTSEPKGVLAFRKTDLADKRIKAQYDLFMKGYEAGKAYRK